MIFPKQLFCIRNNFQSIFLILQKPSKKPTIVRNRSKRFQNPSYLFFIVFFSISQGFWEAKVVQKSRFLLFFWICLWRPYFWSNFVRFLIKSMAKNTGIFSEFSTRRFINCFLNLLISSMLETCKIEIFLREYAYFLKI